MWKFNGLDVVLIDYGKEGFHHVRESPCFSLKVFTTLQRWLSCLAHSKTIKLVIVFVLPTHPMAILSFHFLSACQFKVSQFKTETCRKNCQDPFRRFAYEILMCLFKQITWTKNSMCGRV